MSAFTALRTSLLRMAIASAVGLSSFVTIATTAAHAQDAKSRVVSGSVANVVRSSIDAGRVEPATHVPGMVMYFTRTSAQKSDLATLIRDQQDKTSPLFHKWLTAAEFKQRFGRDAADVASAGAWLKSQGFTVEETTPTHIRFSGTAAQVESAFKTQLHQYTQGSRKFFSNSSEITLPANLAGTVAGVRHLNSLRPAPQHHLKSALAVSPNLTTKTGDHYLVPSDIQTIYDVNALYTAGYTGAGQTLVVVGQSSIDTNDLDNFHKQFGGNTNLILTLLPFTGDSAVSSVDDEEESDLDLEYSGTIAKDAVVNFVYAGNDGSADAFDAVEYAIENNLAPVISISYGACEANVDSGTLGFLSFIFDEGVAQGQSLVAASGDSGATACDRNQIIATQGLAVQFPSDSPDVTGIGGTELNDASGTYWGTTNDANEGSALGYIPEIVWNDYSDVYGLASSGGGASVLFTKPDWQVATGVPADGARDIPDISLDASNAHDAYFFCGPPDDDGNNCSDGYVYLSGGTSFGAPIFSGMLSLINQSTGATGQGNINPLLYPMVTSTPAAFHDIVTGNNDSPCQDGSTDCPTSGTQEIGYDAAPGYDQATGLGSIDASLLAQAFPGYGTGVSLAPTTTALTYLPATPNAGATITFTAVVASTTAGTPTGTVNFLIDGNSATDPVSLVNGTATFASSPLQAGTHLVTAQYSGDSTYASSASSVSIVVAPLPPTSVLVSITPVAPTTATSITAVAGVASAITGTITGTIDFSIDGNDTNNPITITNGAATLAVPALAAGVHTISAQYSGDSNFAQGQGQVSFTVIGVAADTVKVSISPGSPSTTDSVTASASVTAGATGSIQFLLDGTASGSPVALTGTTASASLGTLTAGNHTVTANYLGDNAFAASTGSLPFVVSSSSTAFTLSATALTMGQNQSGDSTITITSAGDYAGTVDLAITGKGPTGACFLVNSNPTVGAGAAATAVIAIYTGTACTEKASAKPITSAENRTPVSPLLPLSFASLAGLLLFGIRKHHKTLKPMLWIILLGALGMTIGCSGGTTSSTPVTPASTAGTYTLTVTGTDSITSTNTASTTLTLTVQ